MNSPTLLPFFVQFKKQKIKIYYIDTDTDEIPVFCLLLKNHIFIACNENTIFIFHM